MEPERELSAEEVNNFTPTASEKTLRTVDTTKKIRELEKELLNTKKEKERLSEECNQWESKFVELETKVKRDETSAKTSRLVEKKIGAAESQNKIPAFKDSKIPNPFENSQRNVISFKTKLQEKTTNTTEQIEKLEKELVHIRVKKESVSEERDEWKRKCAKLEANLELYENQLREKDHTISMTRNLNLELVKDKKKIEDELQRTRRELHGARKKLNEVEKKSHDLQIKEYEVTEIQKNLEIKLAEYNVLDAKLDKRQVQLDRKIEILRKKEENLQTQRAELASASEHPPVSIVAVQEEADGEQESAAYHGLGGGGKKREGTKLVAPSETDDYSKTYCHHRVELSQEPIKNTEMNLDFEELEAEEEEFCKCFTSTIEEVESERGDGEKFTLGANDNILAPREKPKAYEINQLFEEKPVVEAVTRKLIDDTSSELGGDKAKSQESKMESSLSSLNSSGRTDYAVSISPFVCYVLIATVVAVLAMIYKLLLKL